MNSVLCYVHEAEAVSAALRRIHRALRPGGLLVIDNWNFLAQWHRLDEEYGEVREEDGVRLDYLARHWASVARHWASVARHWASVARHWASVARHWASVARHWLEDFAGIYHVEIEATVTESDRSYEFRSDEALKVMTADEVRLRLEPAGFAPVAAYPSYDLSLQDETSGDRMIFLALKPE